jgi:hypothetical protein
MSQTNVRQRENPLAQNRPRQRNRPMARHWRKLVQQGGSNHMTNHTDLQCADEKIRWRKTVAGAGVCAPPTTWFTPVGGNLLAHAARGWRSLAQNPLVHCAQVRVRVRGAPASLPTCVFETRARAWCASGYPDD